MRYAHVVISSWLACFAGAGRMFMWLNSTAVFSSKNHLLFARVQPDTYLSKIGSAAKTYSDEVWTKMTINMTLSLRATRLLFRNLNISSYGKRTTSSYPTLGGKELLFLETDIKSQTRQVLKSHWSSSTRKRSTLTTSKCSQRTFLSVSTYREREYWIILEASFTIEQFFFLKIPRSCVSRQVELSLQKQAIDIS